MNKLIVLVAIGVYIVLSLFYFAGAGRDDTFLTLWAGEQLGQGRLWMNYNLESSEMSSSLLHTIVIAGMSRIFPNHVYVVNKLFGVAVGALILLTLSVYAERFLHDNQRAGKSFWLASLIGPLAMYPAWMYWNIGGLETAMQGFILLFYALALLNKLEHPQQRNYALAITQCLYLLVRPEGFVIIPLTWLCLTLHNWYQRKTWRVIRSQSITAIFAPLLMFAGLLALRYLMLGTLFPNPVYAKIGAKEVASSNLIAGFQYLYGFYTSSPFTLVQFISLAAATVSFGISVVKRTTLNLPLTVLIGLIALNHSFVLLVGGNWMEYFRFIVPIVPFLAFITILISQQALRKFSKRRAIQGILMVVFIAFGIVNFFFQKDRVDQGDDGNCALPLNLKTISHTWTWANLNDQVIQLNCAHKRDWEAIMPFITQTVPDVYQRLGQELRIVSYQMGFFPYMLKHAYPDFNISFIDTAGLIDIQVARLPLAKDSGGIVGYSHLGEILAGEAGLLSDYVLRQHPNMCYTLGLSEQNRRKLLEKNWSVIWDQPAGVVLIKDKAEYSVQDFLDKTSGDR